jgi:hypothetical protein
MFHLIHARPVFYIRDRDLPILDRDRLFDLASFKRYGSSGLVGRGGGDLWVGMFRFSVASDWVGVSLGVIDLSEGGGLLGQGLVR